MSTKKIITGQTGSGKTFKTIEECKKLGSFSYIAPCRQLAYEVFIDYAKLGLDQLSTGEVKLKGSGDFYGVYESLSVAQVGHYSSLIIDEAHYITDLDRGGHLTDLVKEAVKKGVNIFLVTATRNFRKWKGWELVELTSDWKPPKKVEVDWRTFIRRKNEGIPTIEFTKYKSDAMLSADTLPSERLQLQLDYRAGLISYITSTNVLAQGINMPCENLYIEYNPYDDNEGLEQKLGRLGRRGFTGSNVVTFCFDYKKPDKIKKNKKRAIKQDRSLTSSKEWGEITCQEHEIPDFVKFDFETEVSYNQIKYSKPFFEKVKNKSLKGWRKGKASEALYLIEEEEEKIQKIIKENCKNY